MFCTGFLRPVVTELSLPGSQSSRSDLTGDVATLALLVYLTYMNLDYTAVFGTIPPAYGDMAALRTLYLHNTQLSGTISPELGQLTALIDLRLYNTQLSGTIPDALGDMAALTHLDLQGTGVTGCPDFCSRHPRITTCSCPT